MYEKHSILRWLEIKEYPQPIRMLRVLKEHNLYVKREVSYDRFTEIMQAMITIWANQSKEKANV